LNGLKYFCFMQKNDSMRFILFTILAVISYMAAAQVGGERAFDFLNVSDNARVSALGGRNISLKCGELGVAAANPSLLDSTCNNQLLFTRASHFESSTGISHWNMAYANEYGNHNYLVSANFVNYGSFGRYDELAQYSGSFSAKDFALTMAVAHRLIPRVAVGASLKPIYSQMETYSSFAVATDYSATYTDTAHLFTIAAVVRNVGFQLKPYTSANHEQLPWGVDVGYTQKFRYAPLRLSLTYHDLQTFDTRYREAAVVNSFTGEKSEMGKLERFSKNLMSHIVVGAELLLFKNMYVAAGYNYKRYREMDFETRSGITGLSFGMGLKVYRFHISYGREKYHSSGATNVFTFSADLDDFKRN